MLPFETFIDNRGLEHCWESHRTLFRKFSHPNFWQERWRSSRWPLPICCNMLLFATFIDTIGLEHFLKSHRESPSTPNCWHKHWCCSQLPNKLFVKFCLDQNFFWIRIFLDHNFLWTKIFLGPKFFLDQSFVGPKFF